MMEEQDDSRSSNNNNNNTDSVVDRISALPDCILSDILSFLYTEQAVATSLLSKRWKFSWLDIHNLHFDSLDYADIISFIRFVNKALLLIHGRRPLNKFSLSWHRCNISTHVLCWIDAAITRNVCHIHLCLGPGGDILNLPIIGFICDSLRSLRVTRIFFDEDTTLVHLPRLETLELYCARFTSEEAFEKLISGCPMLRHLEVSVHRIPNEDSDEDIDDDAVENFTYTVSSPSLRHLDMYIEDTCTLKLNAPSLEYLKLHGRISEFFVDKSLSSLVEAHFDMDIDDFPDSSMVEAVHALEHAKFLNLSASVMEALGLGTTRLSTKFKRLVKLVAKTYCCSVQDVIQNSEILQELMIDKNNWLLSTIEPYHSRWTAPVVVPKCLSKSLKFFRFTGYKGLEDEREMIRYTLKHGTAHEVMEIHCSRKEDGLKLVQEICEFPRKSPACKIQFKVWPMKRKFQVLY